MPKPFRPQILTGNLLRSGDIVYRNTKGHFVADFRQAAVAQNIETAQSWLAEAENASDTLISAYLFPIKLEADLPEPIHYRDRIRVLGPTFGQQADLAAQWQAAKAQNFVEIFGAA